MTRKKNSSSLHNLDITFQLHVRSASTQSHYDKTVIFVKRKIKQVFHVKHFLKVKTWIILVQYLYFFFPRQNWDLPQCGPNQWRRKKGLCALKEWIHLQRLHHHLLPRLHPNTISLHSMAIKKSLENTFASYSNSCKEIVMVQGSFSIVIFM